MIAVHEEPALAPEAAGALRALREYAQAPEHHYRPEMMPTPGDGTPHTRRVAFGDDSVRVVFTFTLASTGALFRHASFSEPGRRQLPSVRAVRAILPFLGFRGGFSDWQTALHPTEHNVVVIVQEVDPVPA